MNRLSQMRDLALDLERSFGHFPKYCYLSGDAALDLQREGVFQPDATALTFMGIPVTIRPDVPPGCVYMTLEPIEESH